MTEKIVNRKEKEIVRRRNNRDNIVIENNLENKDIDKYINKIFIADSLKFLKTIPDESIDIIVTSPPYNFGKMYEDDEKEDTLEWNEYFAFLFMIWTECFRILKKSGRIAINIQPSFSDFIPTHHRIASQLENIGFLYRTEFTWEKGITTRWSQFGSFQMPSNPYIESPYEYILVFDKSTHQKTLPEYKKRSFGDKWKEHFVDITKEEFLEYRNAKWLFEPEKNMKLFGHPAMFPKMLPRRILKLFSYVDDIVLDPFNGAGTTTFVSFQLKRRYIGVDKSEKYCNVAVKRIKKIERSCSFEKKPLPIGYPKVKIVKIE